MRVAPSSGLLFRLTQIVAKEFRPATPSWRRSSLASMVETSPVRVMLAIAAPTPIRSRGAALPRRCRWRTTHGVVFERLFGDGGSTDTTARLARIHEDRSILDSVIENVADLQRSVGPSDRTKIDQYLEAVRDVERRIQKAEPTKRPRVARP